MTMRIAHPLASIALLAATASQPAWAAYPGGNGDLLYLVRTLTHCEDASIETVAPDGSSSRNLTRGTNILVNASQATWSPDGTRITFVGTTCGASPQVVRLHVMDADGSNIREISIHPARDPEYPTWSPDGQRIAFVAIEPLGGGRGIFTIHADGTDLQSVLGSVPGYSDSYQSLAWSPDGATLLFSGAFRFYCPAGCGFGTEENELYLLRLENGLIEQLTVNRISDEDAVWSPTGRQIAFSRTPAAGSPAPARGATNPQLMVMDLETGDAHDISGDPNNRYFDGMPAWSPDGTLLAYVSTRGSVKEPAGAQSTWKIFTIAPDGTGLRRRVTLGPIHQAPDWQPLPLMPF